jgi:hypothetical protein
LLNGGNVPTQSPKEEKQKAPKGGGGGVAGAMMNALTGSILAGIDAFFEAAKTGSIKDAIQVGFQALGQSLAQAIGGMIQSIMPGPIGAIGGAVVGGLLGLLVSRMGGKTKKQERIPIPVEVVNFPDLWKAWTLPSSAYFAPSGSNSRSVVQNNTNNISVTAGPKVASRVQQSLTEPQFLNQLKRGVS